MLCCASDLERGVAVPDSSRSGGLSRGPPPVSRVWWGRPARCCWWPAVHLSPPSGTPCLRGGGAGLSARSLCGAVYPQQQQGQLRLLRSTLRQTFPQPLRGPAAPLLSPLTVPQRRANRAARLFQQAVSKHTQWKFPPCRHVRTNCVETQLPQRSASSWRHFQAFGTYNNNK